MPLRAVVFTFIVDVTWLLPGLTELGENEQVEEAGSPEQFKETDELYVPPSAATVIA